MQPCMRIFCILSALVFLNRENGPKHFYLHFNVSLVATQLRSKFLLIKTFGTKFEKRTLVAAGLEIFLVP